MLSSVLVSASFFPCYLSLLSLQTTNDSTRQGKVGRISEGRIVTRKKAEKVSRPGAERIVGERIVPSLVREIENDLLGFLDFGPHNEAIDQQTVLFFQTDRNNMYYIILL